MNYGKKIAACLLSMSIAAGTLTGCYTKIKTDEYATTKIASFGDKDIMMDEFNYYVKLYQVSNDNYQQIFSYYYGTNTYKDMYAYVVDKDANKTLWDTVKEDAMRAVYQTYVLCSHAEEYSVALTAEDMEKVDKTIKDFYEEGDSGLVAAINISEDRLKEVLTRNALANKVYDYLVKDIDTKVDEADFRHTIVSYIKVTQAEAEKEETKADESKAETTEAETTEAETTAEVKTVDLKAAAEKIMNDWKKALSEDEKKDVKKTADKIVESYKDSKEVVTAYTDSSNYAKPKEETEGSSSTSTSGLQKYCWNNLKKDEFGIYEDKDAKCVYVLYCKDDDDKKSKESDIEKELDSRRATMFGEKYPDIVKASPEIDVKSRIYAQINWAEINYDVETTAEATTAASSTKSDETTEAESKAEETTAEVTTADAE